MIENDREKFDLYLIDLFKNVRQNSDASIKDVSNFINVPEWVIESYEKGVLYDSLEFSADDIVMLTLFYYHLLSKRQRCELLVKWSLSDRFFTTYID